jgi:hypothetical protein
LETNSIVYIDSDVDRVFDNATYAIWSVGGVEVLVRASLHAMETPDSVVAPNDSSMPFTTLDPGCLSLLSKPDYLLSSGVDSEVYTDSERLHQYLQAELRPRRSPNGPVVVTRVSAHDHRVMCLERVSGKAPPNIRSQVSVARAVITALADLADGSYVAMHSPGDAALCIYKCSDPQTQVDVPFDETEGGRLEMPGEAPKESEMERDWRRLLQNCPSARERSYVKPIWRLGRSPNSALVVDTFAPSPGVQKCNKPCRQFADLVSVFITVAVSFLIWVLLPW